MPTPATTREGSSRRPPRRRKSTYRPKQDIRRTVDERPREAAIPAAPAHQTTEAEATQGRQQVAAAAGREAVTS